MATISGTVQLGSKRLDGEKGVTINSGTAHVTVSFDNTVVKTKSDLLSACRSLIDHFSSDQLK